MKIRLVEMTGYDPGSSSLKVYRFCTGTGYSTSPTDTPANTYYEPRVKQPGLFKQVLYTEGATSGSSKGGYGEIVLVNIDGGLDQLLDIGFDGQLIVVKEGDDSQSLSAFATVITGTCEQLATSWDKITVRLRDNSALLDTPAQLTKYLGNNALPDGVEGTSDLKSKPKPRLLGAAINMTPPCVNTSLLIYQTSDKGLLAVPAVYDGGVVITVGVSRADVTALSSNAPAAGTFDYILGDVSNPSYFRLGSTPAFGITFDGTGIGGQTVGQLCKTLAIEKVGSTKIVEQSIIDLDKASTAPVGFYTGIAEITTAAILDALCASAGAWWGFDNLGIFWCKQLQAPVATQAITTLTQSEIISIDRVATNDGDRGVPPWKVAVQYARNFTVQSSGVAGMIGTGDILTAEATETPLSVDRATRLMMEYFSTSVSDTAVQTVHTLAPEISVKTVLNNKTDADAEALRLLNMRKVRRDRLKVKIALKAVSYPDGGSWDDEAISEMPENRYNIYPIVYNNYVFSVGGAAGIDTWYKVRSLNLSNPTSSWNDTGITDCPSQFSISAVVIYGTFIYAFGLYGGLNFPKSMRFDLTNPTGAWDDAGVTDVPLQYMNTTAVVHGNYVYLLGGYTFAGSTNKTYRLNLTTPTGAWDDAGVTDLPEATDKNFCALYNDFVYLFGGRDSFTNSRAKTLRLNLTTPTGAWDDAGVTNLPVATNNGGCTVVGNYAYILGGYTSSAQVSKTYRLDLNNPQSAWDDSGVADLPTTMQSCSAFQYNNSIYLLGGYAGVSMANTWRLRQNSNNSDLSQLTSLGRTILIKHPRYGYAAGRPMRIIGTEPNYENNSITLDLWG